MNKTLKRLLAVILCISLTFSFGTSFAEDYLYQETEEDLREQEMKEYEEAMKNRLEAEKLQDRYNQLEQTLKDVEKKLKDASLILWVIDPTSDIAPQLERLNAADSQLSEHQQLIVIVNKADIATLDHSLLARHDVIHLSAKTGQGIIDLESKLTDIFRTQTDRHDIIVTNARHYQALLSASEALSRALDALNINLPGDLVSQDIRQAMYHLGEITGEISTDDLLGNIFANFCIGK